MPRGGYQLSTLILFMILAFLLGSLTRAFVQPADFVLMPFTSNNAVPAAPARSEVKEGESLRMIDVAAREIDNFVRAARQLHTFARFSYTDEATLAEMEIEDPFELTGLYHGVDIGRRDSLGPAAEPSRVFLYRRPILDEWCERGDVEIGELIAHVLIHEIGHHLGLTDDDIHAIEDEAE